MVEPVEVEPKKRMKPSSAKAKGRWLQQYVRDSIISTFSGLTLRDVESTSMGAGGVDVKLSEAAFQRFPFTIECKNVAAFQGYTYLDQAVRHTNKSGGLPIAVVKANDKQPVVILTFSDFMSLLQTKEESNETGSKI